MKNSNYLLVLTHKTLLETPVCIPEWLPSPETYEVLELGGISRDFSESKIKEFRLYWIEKNLKKDNWNIIFINFVRKSWVEFNSENQAFLLP